ncbi:MAG: tRNA pseudouridine(38-40) synthase TruA [Acidobacteria bacterium]|nr:tRNA pseudouridine(38-40) synthase TruA [Acidobacteriota bacterium]
MPNFKVTLAYDGTDLVGWQRQAAGTSVQGLLEDVLRDLDGRSVVVHGAGRTDAGAHALGQVASFALERAIAADTLVRAINARLPDAIRVLDAADVDAGFHARFSARAKTYRYRIWNGEVANPFERAYAWHVIGALNVDAMRAAARTLEGCPDFAAFQASGGTAATTEREIYRSQIESGQSNSLDHLVSYEVTGNGFLRHMVRTIVGSLVEIGRGRHDLRWLTEVVASRDRALAGPTAPASGLFLVGVDYGIDPALADEP